MSATRRTAIITAAAAFALLARAPRALATTAFNKQVPSDSAPAKPMLLSTYFDLLGDPIEVPDLPFTDGETLVTKHFSDLAGRNPVVFCFLAPGSEACEQDMHEITGLARALIPYEIKFIPLAVMDLSKYPNKAQAIKDAQHFYKNNGLDAPVYVTSITSELPRTEIIINGRVVADKEGPIAWDYRGVEDVAEDINGIICYYRKTGMETRPDHNEPGSTKDYHTVGLQTQSL